ncbi:MAG: S1 RNA-binding domain-containing protein [bacterium]|nr:S1 RNA-binding domain-containing protein [bacterium]
MPNNQKINVIDQLTKADPNLISLLKIGDLIEGQVLKKEPKRLFLDLGKYGTGIVYGVEFINAKNIIKKLNPGDPVKAKILDLDNDSGYLELSLTEAGKYKVWEELGDLKDQDEPIKIKVTGFNSGGLMTEMNGLAAFLPVSQLSNEHYPRVEDGDKKKIAEELKKIVGQELMVKIIDFNPRTGKLIISEREVVDRPSKASLEKYEAGQIIDGIISGVADFGAFVKFADNPAIEGLIHISELDHRLIDNPKEIVKVDDAVKAKIIDIKNGKIFLSLKALKPNPWDSVEEKYKTGQEVMGVVSKFTPFGAFINLDNEIHGLLHVSEFGSVEEMKKQLEIGKTQKFVIGLINPQEKRLILKLVK